jgi:predicted ATP-grasp superfamily ATP-dependent carboligase
MTARPKVLVTGAQEHQGLAVIRGLGMAGFPVVACGPSRHCLGFYSRYAAETGRYTSPFESPRRFLDDIIRIVRRTRPALVLPTIESTLVVLSEHRAEIERYAPLAAPSREGLESALDKSKTLRLAARLGVPTPRSAQGDDTDAILDAAAELAFPVAIKPRGNALHLSTANALGFKVRYARDLAELAAVLAPFGRDARALLVQEYVPGVGRCVSALCDRGTPVALFAYAREREYPVSGGVSVLRRTIPLDPRLAEWATALLSALHWHGVAMVEFKYDRRADDYTLMEINGRFQASTALSLDAGLNLPALTALLYLGRPLPAAPAARLDVRERWLRGDLLALRDVLGRGREAREPGAPPVPAPSKARTATRFLADFFRPGIRYDEFRWSDWKPALIEGVSLLGWVVRWAGEAVAAAVLHRRGRRVTPLVPPRPVQKPRVRDEETASVA